MCIAFDCNCDVVDHPNGGAFEIKPEYNDERLRFNSFREWTNNAITPKDLALVGFYYTGINDLVKCNFCGIEVGEWKEGDKAYDEHMQIFSNCPLLNNLAPHNTPIDNNLLQLTLQPPDYANINVRIASFKNWPNDKKQTPIELSEAGFYKYKCGDKVRCFTCGGGLKDWTDGDVPWEEHALNYPNCYFVIKMKGEAYIKSIKEKYADVPPILPSSSSSSKSTTTTTTTLSSPQSQTIQPNTSNHSEEQQPKLLNTQLDSPTASSSASKKTKISSHSDPTSVTSLCKICYDSPIDTIFLPCMHIIVCEKCASQIKKCPVCNIDINTAKRVYFS